MVVTFQHMKTAPIPHPVSKRLGKIALWTSTSIPLSPNLVDHNESFALGFALGKINKRWSNKRFRTDGRPQVEVRVSAAGHWRELTQKPIEDKQSFPKGILRKLPFLWTCATHPTWKLFDRSFATRKVKRTQLIASPPLILKHPRFVDNPRGASFAQLQSMFSAIKFFYEKHGGKEDMYH